MSTSNKACGRPSSCTCCVQTRLPIESAASCLFRLQYSMKTKGNTGKRRKLNNRPTPKSQSRRLLFLFVSFPRSPGGIHTPYSTIISRRARSVEVNTEVRHHRFELVSSLWPWASLCNVWCGTHHLFCSRPRQKEERRVHILCWILLPRPAV